MSHTLQTAHPGVTDKPSAQNFLATTACSVTSATETQGEAIGFTRDGRAYVTASEGTFPALHRFQAP